MVWKGKSPQFKWKLIPPPKNFNSILKILSCNREISKWSHKEKDFLLLSLCLCGFSTSGPPRNGWKISAQEHLSLCHCYYAEMCCSPLSPKKKRFRDLTTKGCIAQAASVLPVKKHSDFHQALSFFIALCILTTK